MMTKAELVLELVKLVADPIQRHFVLGEGLDTDFEESAKQQAQMITDVYNYVYENLLATKDKD